MIEWRMGGSGARREACSNPDTSIVMKEKGKYSSMISKHSNPSRYKDGVSSFCHDPMAPG